MKIVHFILNGIPKYGLVNGEEVRELEGDIFGSFRETKNLHELSSLNFLPPVSPTKIVAVGLNYKDHAEEFGSPLPDEPLIFLKPPTALLPHKGKIIYPDMSKRVDYEGELGVIIKRKASKVSVGEAEKFILGYTCVNDVTARDLQRKDVQFTRGKGFDTFAPCGPFIVTDLDVKDIVVQTYLNGELKQNSSTLKMIFKIPFIVSFISHIMTLMPGDLISTGTPAGIGPMNVGDKVEVFIEGIGKLENEVVKV